jgi:hypothetical protein
MRPYLENTYRQKKKGLVEWLEGKLLSTSPSTAKNQNKKKQTNQIWAK